VLVVLVDSGPGRQRAAKGCAVQIVEALLLFLCEYCGGYGQSHQLWDPVVVCKLVNRPSAVDDHRPNLAADPCNLLLCKLVDFGDLWSILPGLVVERHGAARWDEGKHDHGVGKQTGVDVDAPRG
jgi:hypothetical protein